MSEKPESTNDGGKALDEAQVESVAGGSCTGSDIVGITQSLTQAYDNLVDFTSHVIERVMIK
jgi:hypothetical protein